MNKRLLLLFGISIAVVVFNHSAYWCIYSNNAWRGQVSLAYIPDVTPFQAWPFYMLIGLKKLCNFAVPAFLFASGYFAAFTGRKTSAGGSRLKIIANRAAALVIPYLIWSIVILLINPLAEDVSIGKMIARLVYGGVMPEYYFVPLLIQFTILGPLLVDWARNRGRSLLIVSAAIQLSITALTYLSMWVNLPYLQHLFEINRTWSLFPTWCFFFALGMVAGFHLPDFQRFITRYHVLLTVGVGVFGVLSMLESEGIAIFLNTTRGDNPLLLTSTLYSLCLICSVLGSNIDSSRLAKPFYYLSNKTFGIYLVHPIVIVVIPTLVATFIPVVQNLPFIFLLLLIAGGLGVPLLLMFLVRKFAGAQVYKYLFG